RVEIMRGGGSALFGSNAIAGTINIITKEPNSNSANISNTTNLINGEKTDFNTQLNAAIVSDDNKSGLMVFASSRQREALDYDNDGFTEIGILKSKNIGFRTYYKTTNYSKLTLEYHNMDEFRRGGNKLDLQPQETEITEQVEHNINSGGIKYDIYSKDYKNRFNTYISSQGIDRKSYYGTQQDPNAFGSTKDFTFLSGFQFTHTFDTLLFLPAELTGGAEYSVNEMLDKMLGYNRIIDQTVNTKTAFLQNEWKNKSLSILLGGRFDKHNLITKPIISPRLNLRYSPKCWINMRASYSTGFRAPQAFDEDLHITAVGGEVSIIQIDPNLKTEKSESISGSIDYYITFGKVQANFLIEGFKTNLNNVFVLEEIDSDLNGNTILERRNGPGAIVKGINVEGKLVPIQFLEIQFGLTFQKSKYKENQLWSNNEDLKSHNRMFRSPNQYGYFTTNYKINKALQLSLSGTYTGTMLVQHFAGYVNQDTEKETDDFFDFNFKISYEIKLNTTANLQINSGIQNIFNSYQSDFDKGEFRDAGYIYGPSLPRSYFVGLKLSM
ncbi:MAG: TonB-dependent receptor, partial [Bacteroidales bacterium]|nr:TonB-dependent receptor [Bacteroidales bacterium]